MESVGSVRYFSSLCKRHMYLNDGRYLCWRNRRVAYFLLALTSVVNEFGVSIAAAVCPDGKNRSPNAAEQLDST